MMQMVIWNILLVHQGLGVRVLGQTCSGLRLVEGLVPTSTRSFLASRFFNECLGFRVGDQIIHQVRVAYLTGTGSGRITQNYT